MATESAARPTTALVIPRVIPFAAMTLAQASTLESRLSSVSNGIRMHGDWRQRRFVIVRLSHLLNPITQPMSNVEVGELDFPAGLNSRQIVDEARRLGMRVESLRRRSKTFEVEEGIDGERHIVHAFHHRATCGMLGPWPHTPLAISRPTCQRCLIEAAIRPLFRARYHPAIETRRRRRAVT